jgi:hypothetical protein
MLSVTCLIIAVILYYLNFDTLSLIALILGLCFLFIGQVLTRNLKESYTELHKNMPLSWQNISKTLEIGRKSGCGLTDDLGSILKFYRDLDCLDGYFKIIIFEQIITKYEERYGIYKIGDIVLPPRNRAIHYYLEAIHQYPERLPEIIGAVKVKKVPRGNKNEPEKEPTEVLV